MIFVWKYLVIHTFSSSEGSQDRQIQPGLSQPLGTSLYLIKPISSVRPPWQRSFKTKFTFISWPHRFVPGVYEIFLCFAKSLDFRKKSKILFLWKLSQATVSKRPVVVSCQNFRLRLQETKNRQSKHQDMII